uniref:Tc1-like transposase DDE domain-containing protein n=1 Tax=Oncorhynchus tshawytscha TaxID=74940 RepID=A0A8C8FXR6_ONCTS
MADEEAVPGVEGPLVAVTFQRNPHQKQKYLESHPKALGVTQIALSVFYISSVIVILTNGLSEVVLDPPQIIGSVFVIIAGCLAIAAQNLHLPTLKACLGMQVVACVASVFNLIVSVARMEAPSYVCWKYGEGNLTDYYKTCVLFNDDNAPMHKARSIQKWFVEIGVEVLYWPAKSPDLNPIKLLWDELECRLQVRSNLLTSVPNLTNALVVEWMQVPAAMFQHLVESLPRRVEAVIAAKGDQLHINAYDFVMRCSTSRYPHTFGHVVHVVQWGKKHKRKYTMLQFLSTEFCYSLLC